MPSEESLLPSLQSPTVLSVPGDHLQILGSSFSSRQLHRSESGVISRKNLCLQVYSNGGNHRSQATTWSQFWGWQRAAN